MTQAFSPTTRILLAGTFNTSTKAAAGNVIIICRLLTSLCHPLLKPVQEIPSLKTDTPCWEKSLGYFLKESYPNKQNADHADCRP